MEFYVILKINKICIAFYPNYAELNTLFLTTIMVTMYAPVRKKNSDEVGR